MLSTSSPLRQNRNAVVVLRNWENTKNNAFPQTMLFKSPLDGGENALAAFITFVLSICVFELGRGREGELFFFPFGVCFVTKFSLQNTVG